MHIDYGNSLSKIYSKLGYNNIIFLYSIAWCCMKNLPFRTKLFIGFFFLIIGFYTIINPQLAKVSVLIIGLIGVIVYLVAVSSGIFDIIEKGSHSNYLDLEIIPNESNTIQKFINFFYSFIYILIFNFLISISSMFLLYRTAQSHNPVMNN